MNATDSRAHRYNPPRFWFSLLSAATLLVSAYWAASVAVGGVKPHWFAVFSGCMFFALVIFAAALIRRAIEERKKKSVWELPVGR